MDSQVTSLAGQSQPLAEERASLAYLTQPIRSLWTQRPPTPPYRPIRVLPCESRQQRQPMTLEFSLTPPPSPVSRPRVCGGVVVVAGGGGWCVHRGEEAGKRLRSPSHWRRRLPPRARPPTSQERSQAPPGARSCLPRLPPRRWPTAPPSRAPFVTHPPASRSADCLRHATPLTAPPPGPAHWTAEHSD